LAGAVGADRDDEARSGIRDDRRYLHSQSPRMPVAGLTPEFSCRRPASRVDGSLLRNY
jgi:hypothetical protein